MVHYLVDVLTAAALSVAWAVVLAAVTYFLRRVKR